MEICRAHLWYEVNRCHGNRMHYTRIFHLPGYRDVKYKLLLSPADVSRGEHHLNIQIHLVRQKI